MSTGFLKCMIAFAAVAAAAQAQTFERRAVITGAAEGRCVVDILVDGQAEVEVRRENVTVRNLKGQTPTLTRFECSSPMPMNPVDFRFAKVQGRGNVQLLQAPQGDGVAAVKIDDPQNGAGQYVLELRWNGGAPIAPPVVVENRRPRFGTDDAIRVCQAYVRDQAAQRFQANDVVFRRTVMDDQPGRSEWVKGFFEARSPRGEPRNYEFSCGVNFESGQVRSADVQPLRGDVMSAYGDQRSGRAIQACEASVEQRMTQDGLHRIDFGSVHVDDRPGRGEWIVGAASGMERERSIWVDFQCSVDPRGGAVRSVDVTRR